MTDLRSIILIASLSVCYTLFSQPGWQASPQIVESLSKSRPHINYYEEKVPSYTLPDPLITSKGRKVKRSSAWMGKRRDEVLELFRTNVYGRIPGTYYTQKFTIINTDNNALNGLATLKEVDIIITSGGRDLLIRLTLFTPNNKTKPAPAFLLINNRGPAVADPTRKTKSDFWPVEEVIARGYAIAAYNNSDVDPDNFDNFRDGIHAMLDNQRSDDSWGTLSAWAWGASRCLDYMITDSDIAAGKVAVVGHSRGGKTALWAGAVDQRFALVISNESGCGGAALARRKYGETIAEINKSFPHWFCTNYKMYNDNESELPVDMHMLIALSAPRPVYVACASRDLWGDPRGSYLALHHASSVYKLFNKASNPPESMPAMDKQVIYGSMAFHVRSGEHNMLLKDWNFFMDFADRHLK